MKAGPPPGSRTRWESFGFARLVEFFDGRCEVVAAAGRCRLAASRAHPLGWAVCHNHFWDRALRNIGAHPDHPGRAKSFFAPAAEARQREEREGRKEQVNGRPDRSAYDFDF